MELLEDLMKIIKEYQERKKAYKKDIERFDDEYTKVEYGIMLEYERIIKELKNIIKINKKEIR